MKLLAKIWRSVRGSPARFLGYIKRRPIKSFILGILITTFSVLGGSVGYLRHYILYNRENLPRIESFIKFEAPTIGTVYDDKDQIIIELANEYRRIVRPEDIPTVVKNAILSAEDRNYYNHNGVDWEAALLRATKKNAENSYKIMRRTGFKFSKIQFQQGASTVTQQIVRLYFLSNITKVEKKDELVWQSFWPRSLSRLIGAQRTNSIFRKIEEAKLAEWLEEELAKPEYFGSKQKAKEEILARFVSYVYLGYGRYGVDAASEFYFNKKVNKFTDDDADKSALLAGIIKNPAAYSPSVNPTRLDTQRQLSRRNEVLNLMVDNGYISAKEVNKFKQRELPTVERNKAKTAAPSMVGDIFKELKKDSQNVEDLFNGRILVYSTADLKIQNVANQALENGLKAYEERHREARGLAQGSVVVLRNSDGAVLAQVGGREFFNGHTYKYSDLNRVTYSVRQPGSAFKPFVYLTAFENGLTLNSIVVDSPISVSMGSVKVGNKWIRRPPKWIANYDGKFKGPIPARKALAESRNAVAIRLAKNLADGKMTGIERIVDVAHILGIKSSLHNPNEKPYITTALGASEVNLLELTNAYRAIASGLFAEPYMIAKVTDRSGKVLFLSQNQGRPITEDFITTSALRLIQEGLRGVVRIPGGTAHSLDNKNFPIPVLGKTGTTNDFKDAWFVGSTFGPDGITIGAHVGFDEPSLGYDKKDSFSIGPERGLGKSETGGRVALPIFREIMLKVYREGLVGPVPQFPEEIEKNIDNYLHNPL